MSTLNLTFSISSNDTTLCLPVYYNPAPYSPFHMASQETEDLKTFTTYCDKPYDRHHYKIIFKDGKSVTVDEYELARMLWYQSRDDVVSMDVVDYKTKKKGGEGF